MLSANSSIGNRKTINTRFSGKRRGHLNAAGRARKKLIEQANLMAHNGRARII